MAALRQRGRQGGQAAERSLECMEDLLIHERGRKEGRKSGGREKATG